MSWPSVGISGLATGLGFGTFAVPGKINAGLRSGDVLAKAAAKRVPLSNYMKGQVAKAAAERSGAVGAGIGFGAAQAAKVALKNTKKNAVNANANNQPSNGGKEPCP